MSVLKYKDPETGEVKKVGLPSVDTYTKAEVDAKFAAIKAYKPTITQVTLSSNKWIGSVAPYTYTLTGYDGKTVEIVEDVNMTMEQLEAIENAKIKSDPRSNENILYAFGDKPTIDVPVLLVVH